VHDRTRTLDDFSPDYASARSRFRESVERAGGSLESLALTARGPAGEDLTIDIGWFGPESPRRVLIHSSGLHGVEAFAGSAIQLSLIAQLRARPPDTALVFAHVLNPYGMAWLRRVNESNVYLNRNFLPDGETYAGRPDGYDELYGFLNPSRLPTPDLFAVRAGWLLWRHGRSTLEAAVVAGQYDYPEGLFFGGRGIEEGPRRYRDFLVRRMSGVERVFAVDVHTGLGPFGEDTVLVGESGYERFRRLLGSRVQTLTNARDNVAYRIRGGLHEMVPWALPTAHVDVVGQEFGTYGPVRVLAALRSENCAFRSGRRGPDEPSRQRLLHTFAPADPKWRRKVLVSGCELHGRALASLDDPAF
jgi:hypothetical protein